MNGNLLKQSKSMPAWVGALQVQISNSMFYLSLISTGMMVLTFWYTAGYQIQQTYLLWLDLWIFILVVIAVLIMVMILDYTFVYPARQKFLNIQSCKHENPAMIEILELRKEVSDIKRLLEDGKCK